MRAVFERPGMAAALAAIGLDNPDMLVSWYTAGPDAMRAFVNGGDILTDDRPLLEYHRSLPPDAGQLDISPLRGRPEEVFVGLQGS